MNIDKIISIARFETNTANTKFPQDYIIESLNDIYKELWDLILEVDEKYFWNIWKTNINKNQTEYDIMREETINREGTIIPGISKIQNIKILSKNKYTTLKELTENERERGDKWWFLADNHIILNWIPTEEIENWILLEGVESVNRLKIWGEKESIFPWHLDLARYWKVLLYGLKWKLWEGKQDFDKSSRAFQFWENEKEKMSRSITQRTQWIYFSNIE